LIYLLFSKLLSWIVLRTRSETAKEIEILVLRLWVPGTRLTFPDLLDRHGNGVAPGGTVAICCPGLPSGSGRTPGSPRPACLLGSGVGGLGLLVGWPVVAR
jgi:hypothetical protein